MATEVESNEDLLREILLRLPVKPLLRLKCVSKRWLALISEPQFCHSHTLRQYHGTRPFPSALLIENTTDANASSLSCPIIPLKSSGFDSSSNLCYVKVPGMRVAIMQSCNGLLLLEGDPLESTDFPLEIRHFVYNPTTNQFVAINFPSPVPLLGSDMFLSFEPLRSPHYKVISISSTYSSTPSLLEYVLNGCSDLLTSFEHEYFVNVYSSETGSWSDPGGSFTSKDLPCAVYCNGALYFYSTDMDSKYFDVENQCFKTFPMPLGIRDENVWYFGESGRHLHLIVKSQMNFELDIWELNEDNSGWSVRFHVNLCPVQDVYPELTRYNTNVCIVRQVKEVDSILVFSMDGSVIAYNLVDSTYSFSSCLDGRERCDVFDYYENLSCVDPSHNY